MNQKRVATYYAPDEQEFDICRKNTCYYVYNAQIKPSLLLMTCNHFPTYDEVMDECWQEDEDEGE